MLIKGVLALFILTAMPLTVNAAVESNEYCEGESEIVKQRMHTVDVKSDYPDWADSLDPDSPFFVVQETELPDCVRAYLEAIKRNTLTNN